LLRRNAAGVAVALAFFLLGCLALDDYGYTIDESASYDASLRNLSLLSEVLHGKTDIVWRGHVLPGYYFVLDTYRGSVANLLANKWKLLDFVSGYHFANLVLSSLSVYLLYAIVVLLSENRRVATFSALTLGLFPRFIAHSQNNPKDLIGLFAFTLAVYTILRVHRRGRWVDATLAGISLGLLVTSSTLGFLVVPVLAVWIAVHELPLARQHWKQFVALLAVGAVSAFVLWPWLWADPLGRLVSATERLLTFGFDVRQMHLGGFYSSLELPWHYFIANFLCATPLSFLIFALLSLLAYRQRGEMAAGSWSLTTLGWVWFVLPLFVEASSSSRYGVLRHFLFTFPGFCIVAGVGAEILYQGIRTLARERFRGVEPSRLAAAGVGLLFVWILIAMVRIHPYQGAFLNVATNAVLPREAQHYFELEYWGHPYKEGAAWLAQHAEPGAEVFVPIFPFGAEPSLGYTPARGTPARFTDSRRTRYLMFITRVARYNKLINLANERYDPVFTIRRQNATLLKIFVNSRPKVE
jgi:hypothetical protein